MKRITIIFFALTMCASIAHSQAQEKLIYFTTDKPYHAAGERLGYTIYALDRVTQKLLNDPQIVYVELFHPYGKKIIGQVLQTNGGMAQGMIILPDTLSSAEYNIAVYQKPAQAIQSPQITWKTIPIDGKNKMRKPLGKGPVLTVRAEGGVLVTGMENIVAVHLSNNGTGIQQDVIIKDRSGRHIATCSTSVNGVGSFQITPNANEIYTCESSVAGTTIRTIIPSLRGEGCVLRVDDSSIDTLRISVHGSAAYLRKKLRVKIISRGVTNVETGGIMNSSGLRLKVPTAGLLSGIAQVEVLDGEKIIATRQVMLEEKNQASVTLKTSSQDLPTRGRVRIYVSTSDHANKPARSKFNVSVYNQRYSPTDKSNIVSALKYSNLNIDTKLTPKELDDYLIASPFDTLRYKPTFANDYMNVLRGSVLEKKSGKPIADTTIIMSIVGLQQKRPILVFKKTDAQGRFEFTIPPVNGNYTVVLKVNGTNDLQSLVEYRLDQLVPMNQLPEPARSNYNFELGAAGGYFRISEENRHIANSFGAEPIKIKEANNAGFNDYVFTDFDAIYRMEDYVVLPTMQEVLSEVVTGVAVRKSKDGLRIRVMLKDQYSNKFNVPFVQEPLILIDGVPVFNTSIVAAIPTSEVQHIEVAHDHLFFDKKDIYGIISITTFNKRILYREDINQFTQSTTGFPTTIDFQFPQHGDKRGEFIDAPDLRTLLFYQPVAETDASGESVVEFFTSDDTGSFLVKVEGITEDGLPFASTMKLNVSYQR